MSKSKNVKVLVLIFGALLAAGICVMLIPSLTDPGGSLVVAEAELIISDDGKRIVSGIVENSTDDTTYTRVQVDITFFDETGKGVGNSSVVRQSLAPQDEWNFKIPGVPKRAATFKASVSSPDLMR